MTTATKVRSNLCEFANQHEKCAKVRFGHEICWCECHDKPATPDHLPVVAEHTPTPWKVDDDSGIYYVVAPEIALVATLDPSDDDAPAEANAAFIVKAVNSHESNLARITELETALREISAYIPTDTNYYEYCGIMQNIARRALNSTTKGD